MNQLKLIFNKQRLLILLSCLIAGCTALNPADQIELSNDNLSNDSIEYSSGSKSRYLFVLAELELKRENYKKALSLLEEAKVASEKKSPTISKRLAQLYIREGKLDEALKSADDMENAGGVPAECIKLKAGILTALGRTEDAINSYKKLVEVSGKTEEEPSLLLSGIYIQNSRFQDAVLVLENLFKNNSNSFISAYYLAKLHASLKDFDKSVYYYKKAIELNSSAEQVALEFVKVLVLSNKSSEAIKECQKIVNQNPDNEKARELLGELLLGDKKIESALSEFEEAKKLGKNSVELQLKVALLKLQQRDFKGAEEEFHLILNQKPDFDEAHYYLATAYASQDKIDAAVNQLKKISARNDLYKKGCGFSAFLLRQNKKFDDALSIIKDALKKFPNDVELLSYKTSIERESGDLNSAIETLKKISSLEPENEQHLFNLGVALDEANKRAEAFQIMEKVIEKNPQHANALNYVGYTLAEEGRELPRAEQLINKAIAAEKENGFFIDSLGWVYYQQGDFEKAKSTLEKSSKLTNGDPVVLDHLAKTYLKLKMQKQAKDLFLEAISKLKKSTTEADLKLMSEIEQILKTLPSNIN